MSGLAVVGRRIGTGEFWGAFREVPADKPPGEDARRPAAGYLFAASYFIYRLPLPGVPGLAYCYHLQCLPHPEDPVEQAVQRIAGIEMRNLLDGRCSPHRPEWGNLGRFISKTKTTVAGGAARLILNGTRGTLRLHVDRSQAARLGRPGIEAVHGLAAALPKLLPLPSGRRADFPADEILRSYATDLWLLPRCAILPTIWIAPQRPLASSRHWKRRRSSGTGRMRWSFWPVLQV